MAFKTDARICVTNTNYSRSSPKLSERSSRRPVAEGDCRGNRLRRRSPRVYNVHYICQGHFPQWIVMALTTCCRFIAVTQPIRYSKQKGSSRAYLALIAMTWIISLAVSSPIALGMNYTERRRLTPTVCTFYNSDFLICSSMASFYIPCIVMLVLYCKMFRSIRQMARR